MVWGAANLEIADADSLELERLTDTMVPGGNIVLAACSTGWGKQYMPNVAQLFAKAMPNANVWAPCQPSNNRVQFNSDGSFRAPGYLADGNTSATVYRIPPHIPARTNTGRIHESSRHR
jgi:hypothetical protein